MSATNNFEQRILELVFQNVDFTGIGDAGGLRGSAVPGDFHISLHTADPGEGGNQDSSEADYTSYARIPVVRSAAGWAVAGDTASNAAAITFPQATGGNNLISHFGIGDDLNGPGVLHFKGALTAPLAVSDGVQPEFAIGNLTVTAD